MERRTVRVACFLGLVLGLGLTWWLPNPVLNPVPTTQALARPLPFTDVNPLGANFFLDREVETWKKQETLRMARAAGLGWVKQMFPWDQIEPQKGLFWDDRIRRSTWDKFDEIVNLVEQYGLRLIVRLDQPPEWARSRADSARYPVRDLNEFGDYVARVVARYRGRIQHYQIWNEPNLAREWGGRPPDPVAYTELLKVAYQRAKAVDPNVVILSAPLAQTLERSPQAIDELDFLEGMYAAGAAAYFDILMANAYGFDRPPEDPPDPRVLNFQRLKLLRDVMVRNGDAAKPVWLNEFGWNAAPPTFPPFRLYWGRVTEEEQAAYTVRAVRMARQWDWLGVINLWYFRQVGDISPLDSAEYYFRVVDPDFTPRPLYFAIQQLSEEFKFALPGEHQETSPAVQTEGRWNYVRADEASARGYIESSAPGARLVFNFRGTGVQIIPGPGSGRVYVQLDGHPVSGLSTDAAGQTWLELGGDTAGRPVTVTRTLTYGQHRLTLTVPQLRPGEMVRVDAFVVLLDEPDYRPALLGASLAALSLVGLGLTFIPRRP
jgi:hypothetical protein